MTRTTKNLLLLGLVLAAVAAGIGPFLAYTPNATWLLFLFGVLLFIPGRLSSVYLKDLYRSRRFFEIGRYEKAIGSGQLMLAALKTEPWRENLIYLTWQLYSWNIAAMAYNNIGASLMMLGRFDEARSSLRAALAEDPGYALPYANLAAIEAALGNRAESEVLARRAQERGYSGRRIDLLIDRVGAAYAEVQAPGG